MHEFGEARAFTDEGAQPRGGGWLELASPSRQALAITDLDYIKSGPLEPLDLYLRAPLQHPRV